MAPPYVKKTDSPNGTNTTKLPKPAARKNAYKVDSDDIKPQNPGPSTGPANSPDLIKTWKRLVKNVKDANASLESLRKPIMQRYHAELSKKDSPEKRKNLKKLEEEYQNLEKSSSFQKAYQKLIQAKEKLDRHVRIWQSLYAAALKSNHKTRNKRYIQEFYTLTTLLDDELLFSHYAFPIRLRDPRLTQQDRVLVTKNIPKKWLLPLCLNHYIKLKKAALKAYTGLENIDEMPEGKRALAFFQLCEGRFGRRAWVAAYDKILKKKYEHGNGLTWDEYKRIQGMPNWRLRKVLQKNLYQFTAIPPGTNEKVWSYRRLKAIEELANLRGLYLNPLQDDLVGLPSHYFDYFDGVSEAKVTFEISDDKKLKTEFKPLFQNLYSKYLSTSATEHQLIYTLTSALEYMGLIGRDFGFSLKDLRSWMAEIKIKHTSKLKPDRRQIPTKKDLCKSSYIVTPKDLSFFPKPIDPFNSRSGLKSIHLAPKIYKSESDKTILGANGEGGAASPLLGYTTISICSSIYSSTGTSNLRLKPVWIIDELLNHEGSHNLYFERFFDKNPQMLRSIPNERHSYLVSRATYLAHRARLLDKGTPPNSNDLWGINYQIAEVELNLRSTNKILGYKLDDFTFREDLPPDAKHMDLDVYPSNTFPLILYDYIEQFVKPVGLSPNEASLAKKTLRNILSGDIKIEAKGTMETDDKGNGIAKSLKVKNTTLSRTIFHKGRRRVAKKSLVSHPVLDVLQVYLKINKSGKLNPKTFKALHAYANPHINEPVINSSVFKNLARSLEKEKARKQAKTIAVLLNGQSFTQDEITTMIDFAYSIVIGYKRREVFESNVRNPKTIDRFCEMTGLPNKRRRYQIVNTAINISRLFYDKKSGKSDLAGFLDLIDKTRKKGVQMFGFNTFLRFDRSVLTKMMTQWYVEKYREDWVKKMNEAKKSPPSSQPATHNF